MAYPACVGLLQASADRPLRTVSARTAAWRTASVQRCCVALLTAGLVLTGLTRPAAAGQASAWGWLTREQDAGWLELRRGQRTYREQLRQDGAERAPGAAASLDLIERQEELDRRALDLRERQWLDAERRRQTLSGSPGPMQGPALRMRVEQAEANERLRRDLQRRILQSVPGAAPAQAPTPFRLR